MTAPDHTTKPLKNTLRERGHPYMIFALLAFGSLFGFTGLITAVPFAAAAGVILRFAVQRYRESNLYTEIGGPGAKLLLDSKLVRPTDEDR